MRLRPGQLGEVAEVGFVLDDGVFVDDGGSDVSLRFEPKLDNLLQTLLNMVRGQLELDNILRELKIHISSHMSINIMNFTSSTSPLLMAFLTGSMLLGHWAAHSSARWASSWSQLISLMLDAAGMPSLARDPLAI